MFENKMETVVAMIISMRNIYFPGNKIFHHIVFVLPYCKVQNASMMVAIQVYICSTAYQYSAHIKLIQAYRILQRSMLVLFLPDIYNADRFLGH